MVTNLAQGNCKYVAELISELCVFCLLSLFFFTASPALGCLYPYALERNFLSTFYHTKRILYLKRGSLY